MGKKGHLFLCATPIGNLQDITLRVLETLKTVDLIACEDTRHTLKLLNHFNINKPITSYFEHNKHFKGEKILAQLLSGKNVALVSDAGMPGISDPGYELVVDCLEREIEVTALPGAVALTTGLVVSGLETRRFCFEGFIPRGKKEKKLFLQSLVHEERTLIFYESPHRLLDTLNVLANYLGTTRKIAVCRELTKKFEEVKRGTIREVLDYFQEKNIRGEFTLVVQGAEPIKEARGLEWACKRVEELVEEGYLTKEAIKLVAKEADISRRELYEKILVKKKEPYR